jgi:predicted kinase
MSSTKPTLHLLCGKIASGKSTLAKALGQPSDTVIIAEDDWLNALFSGEMATLSEYVRCAGLLRTIMGQHVATLLNSGVSVVLDFQANTLEARGWMRDILGQTDANHILHVLETQDDICIARLHARNAKGEHPFAATEEQFHQVSRHFVAPSPDEGFNVVTHSSPQ